ncbi:MAG TPA: hypothetical protein VE195_10900 [Acidobacteriaceae bacterium]|nr:hypothetical protein [Acidobacteriaceae bacterium]
MPEIAQIEVKPAMEVARLAPMVQASNGIRYGSFGDTQLAPADLQRVVEAVPSSVAAALHHKRYYFVPLTLSEPLDSELNDPAFFEMDSSKLMIAADFSTELSDMAICHRNAKVDGTDCIFISTRLMQDRFALSFEFYINAGHHFVDAVGVPESFMRLVWSQAEANVRGETSQDAWEQRLKALGSNPMHRVEVEIKRRRPKFWTAKRSPEREVENRAIDEKARMQYLEAAFSDAVAIYLLSLTVDFDYSELREREYPLLAAPALAERLRHVAKLFPPPAAHEFSIHYRRNR